MGYYTRVKLYQTWFECIRAASESDETFDKIFPCSPPGLELDVKEAGMLRSETGSRWDPPQTRLLTKHWKLLITDCNSINFLHDNCGHMLVADGYFNHKTVFRRLFAVGQHESHCQFSKWLSVNNNANKYEKPSAVLQNILSSLSNLLILYTGRCRQQLFIL